jgi:hypothetical protein
MGQPRGLERLTRREVLGRRWSEQMAWLLLAWGAAAVTPAGAQNAPPLAAVTHESPFPIDQALEETTKGHGWVSVGYRNTYINNMLNSHQLGGIAQIGSVRVQSISLDLGYFFADHWSAHLGIPFIESRYSGSKPHCPTTDPPQCKGKAVPNHPESQFLDDGDYHGAWQDWDLGVAYHVNVNDYLLAPSITAYVPSHRYTFFANAAVGQDLRKIEVAIDLAHQFELSNLYYRVNVGRVFVEKTTDQNIDYNKLDLELGYFLNEIWTLKVFGVGKRGNGYTGLYPDLTSDLWYHHDQRTKHNYANVGVGVDYHLNDKYILSTAVQRLVWGQFVFDFKYSLDVRLTREF